jgi:5'-nucleotidase
LKANFAFQNSGGLRISEIPPGPITFGQIFDLYPFDNQQVVVSLAATQVRNALESVLHAGKGPLRVSGLRYTIDWEHMQSMDIKDAPAGAIVIYIVDESTGNVLCETKSCTATECQSTCAPGTFTVAVTDFLANGGDGLTILKDAPARQGAPAAHGAASGVDVDGSAGAHRSARLGQARADGRVSWTCCSNWVCRESSSSGSACGSCGRC